MAGHLPVLLPALVHFNVKQPSILHGVQAKNNMDSIPKKPHLRNTINRVSSWNGRNKRKHEQSSGCKCPRGFPEPSREMCYAACATSDIWGTLHRAGPMCYYDCPAVGFRDDGLTCAKLCTVPPGYAGLSDCERDFGVGSCEWNGPLIYPRCSEGNHATDCCNCWQQCPDGFADLDGSCSMPPASEPGVLPCTSAPSLSSPEPTSMLTRHFPPVFTPLSSPEPTMTSISPSSAPTSVWTPDFFNRVIGGIAAAIIGACGYGIYMKWKCKVECGGAPQT